MRGITVAARIGRGEGKPNHRAGGADHRQHGLDQAARSTAFDRADRLEGGADENGVALPDTEAPDPRRKFVDTERHRTIHS